MDNDQRFWICIWGMVISGVVGLAAVIAIGVNVYYGNIMKNGYQEQALAGSTNTVLVKASK